MVVRITLAAAITAAICAYAKPVQAYTAELCTGVVTRTTVAIFPPNLSEDGEEKPLDNGIRRPGYKFSVVALLINHRTASRLLCDLRGGECLAETAVHLLHCSVGTQVTRDGVTDQYSTVLNRAATPETDLRESELEEVLMTRFEICHACAGNVAYVYVHKPQSLCAQLIRSALEGNADAIAKVFPKTEMGRDVNERICH